MVEYTYVDFNIFFPTKFFVFSQLDLVLPGGVLNSVEFNIVKILSYFKIFVSKCDKRKKPLWVEGYFKSLNPTDCTFLKTIS